MNKIEGLIGRLVTYWLNFINLIPAKINKKGREWPVKQALIQERPLTLGDY